MTQYNNPVKIEFGIDSLNFLPRYINGRKALLLTSAGFEKRDYIDNIRGNNSTIVKVIKTVQPNPTIEQVKEIRLQLCYNDFDIIVALGGGSVIDVAKALSIYDEKGMLNIELAITEGLGDKEFEIKPIIAIPTTAGTGSEVTPWGTIWDDINKRKFSISHDSLWCEVAILDPSLHLTIPRELTIQTGLDALSHSLESIWNFNTNPTSQLYAISAAKMIIEVLPKLMDDLSNVELREKMLLASLRAGLAFSNTQTSIAHAMSYYMTLHKNIPHGIAASITLPSIIQIALEIEECKAPLNSIFGDNALKKIIHFFNELGISTEFENYGLNFTDLKKIEESLKYTSRSKNSIVSIRELFDNLYKKC